MKKLLALLLCILMIVTLAACSDKEENEDGEKEKAPATSITLQNGDTFMFTDVNSVSVRITDFTTANDTAHEVTIPAYLDGKIVVEISEDAFASLSSISKINFPTEADFVAGDESFVMAEYAMTIDAYAFHGCDNLKSITIPAYVKEIGEAAFCDCGALEEVVIEGGTALTSIEKATFWQCTALRSITIPANIKVIRQGAFFECTALESVTLAEGVVEVGAQAFQNCTKLTTVSLPSTVTLVGNNALAGCKALTAVNYAGNTEQVLNYIDQLKLPQ